MDGGQEVVAFVAWLFQASEQGRGRELDVIKVGQGMIDWIRTRAEWKDPEYQLLSVLDISIDNDC